MNNTLSEKLNIVNNSISNMKSNWGLDEKNSIQELTEIAQLKLQDKAVEVIDNGEGQTIISDEEYNGLNSVTVNVAPAPGALFRVLEWSNSGPKSVEISEGVTSIPACFKSSLYTSSYPYHTLGFLCSVKKIKMPSTITTIGEKGLENAMVLSEINLEHIKNIYNEAFKYCQALKNITLNEGINTGSGFTRNPNKLQYATFLQCKGLETINIPSNIIAIGASCFAQCENLQLTELPEGIIEIGSGYMPSGGTSYSGNTFSGCSKITISKLPDSLTSMVGQSNFSRCKSLTKFNLNNVTQLHGYDFQECSNLVSVVMPKLVKNNAPSQSYSPFDQCSKLKAAWFGSALTNLPLYTFKSCSSLMKIYIDLPRSTVETFAGYSKGFTYDVNNQSKVICNDDDGFLTQEQFEATDWTLL